MNNYPSLMPIADIEGEIKKTYGRMPNISAAIGNRNFNIDGVWYKAFYGDLIGEYEGGRLGNTKFICKSWRYNEKIVRKLIELGY